ncbi:hypothetical protein [Mycobacterium sp.]|nr:hypothetical protein [Mycobacterium sp.]
MITAAHHVTVALTNGGVSRVHGLSGDGLNGRADELPDPVTTNVARGIGD